MYAPVLVYPETPTLPELLRLRIPQKIGPNYVDFGIFLLQDYNGSAIRSIEEDSHRRPERVILRILQNWLEGKGQPVTWRSLIEVLRECGLNILAFEIEKTIKGILYYTI